MEGGAAEVVRVKIGGVGGDKAVGTVSIKGQANGRQPWGPYWGLESFRLFSSHSTLTCPSPAQNRPDLPPHQPVPSLLQAPRPSATSSPPALSLRPDQRLHGSFLPTLHTSHASPLATLRGRLVPRWAGRQGRLHSCSFIHPLTMLARSAPARTPCQVRPEALQVGLAGWCHKSLCV